MSSLKRMNTRSTGRAAVATTKKSATLIKSQKVKTINVKDVQVTNAPNNTMEEKVIEQSLVVENVNPVPCGSVPETQDTDANDSFVSTISQSVTNYSITESCSSPRTLTILRNQLDDVEERLSQALDSNIILRNQLNELEIVNKVNIEDNLRLSKELTYKVEDINHFQQRISDLNNVMKEKDGQIHQLLNDLDSANKNIGLLQDDLSRASALIRNKVAPEPLHCDKFEINNTDTKPSGDKKGKEPANMKANGSVKESSQDLVTGETVVDQVNTSPATEDEPLTINQTKPSVEPIKTVKTARKKSKVLLIGDSHLRNMLPILNNNTSDKCSFMCIFKPNATFNQVTSSLSYNTKGFTKNDQVYILAGCNDVSKNNHFDFNLNTLVDVVSYTNVNIVLIPYRFDDLSLNSCIYDFNVRLCSFAATHNIGIIDTSLLKRNLYTSFGLHLNRLGKTVLCDYIISDLKPFLTPVSILNIGKSQDFPWGMRNKKRLKKFQL